MTPECGTNQIEAPNFNGNLGDKVSFYDENNGYLRKTDKVLLEEGLIELKEGQILDGDSIREMTEVEMIQSGLLKMPEDYEIIDGQLVETANSILKRDIAKIEEEMSDFDKSSISIIRRAILTGDTTELQKVEDKYLILEKKCNNLKSMLE